MTINKRLISSNRDKYGLENERPKIAQPRRVRDRLGLLLVLCMSMVLVNTARMNTRLLEDRVPSTTQQHKNHTNQAIPLVEFTFPAGRGSPQNAQSKGSSLRFDWSDLPPITPLGKRMDAVQSQCLSPSAQTKPQSIMTISMSISGMGSSLHGWMAGLCHATEHNAVLLTRGDHHAWNWNDQSLCPRAIDEMRSTLSEDRRKDNQTFTPRKSSLWCYFGSHESAHRCPPHSIDLSSASFEDYNGEDVCPQIRETYGFSGIRAAAAEWLFQNVSQLVIDEAERQIQNVAFPNLHRIPSRLISVHIRWGDKGSEMKLATISEYIDAIQSLLTEKERDGRDKVHLYVTTEDSQALADFKHQTHQYSHWNIYSSGSQPAAAKDSMLHAAVDSNGRVGLESLAALLIAMEANRFVLVNGSNWSRLINELRKNIVNPRCNNCTKLVDLRPHNEEEQRGPGHLNVRGIKLHQH